MLSVSARLAAPAVRLLVLVAGTAVAAGAQEPTGLAASALADSSFHWIPRTTPGFRVNFLADSYPAQHQDSLLARLGPAVEHARELIGAPPLSGPIDLFFLESREQMTRLIGGRATGFAQPSARAVFLVTNPGWRAFERHEIMHVVAGQTWGPAAPGMDWLVEGLAQAADGACAGRSNTEVMRALAERRGWIPLTTILQDFRRQPDLRAYLQAASFVGYLLDRVGPAPLHALWSRGATGASRIGGRRLDNIESAWRAGLRVSWHPASAELDRIEAGGCG